MVDRSYPVPIPDMAPREPYVGAIVPSRSLEERAWQPLVLGSVQSHFEGILRVLVGSLLASTWRLLWMRVSQQHVDRLIV